MLAWLRGLISQPRVWLSPRQVDKDFDQELEAHLDLLTEENVQPEEAKRAARIRLGGRTQLKETNRELHGLPAIETFLQHTRYAFRMLGKNPGFTAVALLTLALGIAPTRLSSAPAPFFSLLMLGAFGTGVAFASLATAAGRVGATRASSAAFLIPAIALLLGVLVRGENVAMLSIIGSAICVAGAWLMRRAEITPESDFKSSQWSTFVAYRNES